LRQPDGGAVGRIKGLLSRHVYSKGRAEKQLFALSLFLFLFGTQKYQCISDFESPGYYFFVRGKTYNWTYMIF
jgi:hypothetical protein